MKTVRTFQKQFYSYAVLTTLTVGLVPTHSLQRMAFAKEMPPQVSRDDEAPENPLLKKTILFSSALAAMASLIVYHLTKNHFEAKFASKESNLKTDFDLTTQQLKADFNKKYKGINDDLQDAQKQILSLKATLSSQNSFLTSGVDHMIKALQIPTEVERHVITLDVPFEQNLIFTNIAAAIARLIEWINEQENQLKQKDIVIHNLGENLRSQNDIMGRLETQLQLPYSLETMETYLQNLKNDPNYPNSLITVEELITYLTNSVETEK